jgi:hypothetical protein
MMNQTKELSAYIIEMEALTVSSDNLLDEIAYALQPELRLNVEPGNWRHLYALAREMNNFTYDDSEAHATRAGQIVSLVVTLWHMFKHASATVYSQHIEIRGLRRKLQQTSAELESANSAITDAQGRIVSLQEMVTEQEKALALYQQETDELRREIVELSQQPQNENYRVGYVYLIAASNGTYKIGRTKNPNDRMKTFGLRLPFAVEYLAVIPTDDMYILEKELHRRFKKKRLNGSEFFQLDSDDIAYIVGLSEAV